MITCKNEGEKGVAELFVGKKKNDIFDKKWN